MTRGCTAISGPDEKNGWAESDRGFFSAPCETKPPAIVLITELLNSAVESAVDRVSEDPHELAGRAKDQGSAAVFVSLALVVVVWGSVIVHNFVLS